MHMWIYRWCGKGIDRYRYRFVCGCLFMISLPHFKNMEVFEDKVFFSPYVLLVSVFQLISVSIRGGRWVRKLHLLNA